MVLRIQQQVVLNQVPALSFKMLMWDNVGSHGWIRSPSGNTKVLQATANSSDQPKRHGSHIRTPGLGVETLYTITCPP